MEGVAILFSFSRSNSAFLRHAQRLVAILLCGLTLFVMSGRCIKNAVGDTTQVQSLKQTMQQLELELSQKQQLREELLRNRWLGAARRYERGMDQIRNRMTQVRQELNSLRSPVVIFNGLGILISFRLLLVITNLISVHRIVEYLENLSETQNGQKGAKNVLNFLN